MAIFSFDWTFFYILILSALDEYEKDKKSVKNGPVGFSMWIFFLDTNRYF